MPAYRLPISFAEPPAIVEMNAMASFSYTLWSLAGLAMVVHTSHSRLIAHFYISALAPLSVMARRYLALGYSRTKHPWQYPGWCLLQHGAMISGNGTLSPIKRNDCGHSLISTGLVKDSSLISLTHVAVIGRGISSTDCSSDRLRAYVLNIQNTETPKAWTERPEWYVAREKPAFTGPVNLWDLTRDL